jgi:hypothetical protein
MKNINIVLLAGLMLLGSCGEPTKHKHAAGDKTAATSDKTGDKTAAVDSSKIAPPVDKSKQIMIGAGFGWRKVSEPTADGAVDLDMSLSYGYKIIAKSAACGDSGNNCILASFDLQHQGKSIFSFPNLGAKGKMNIDLQAHELPCLLVKGEQIAVVFPMQKGETTKSITLDVVKISNGKSVWLENISPYEGATPTDAQMTAIFDRVFQ